MNGFLKFLTTPGGRIAMIFFFAVVVFMLIFLAVMSDADIMMFAVVALCGFFGWKALSRLTVNLFLWMNWVGWLFYFILKGFLSVTIGLVVAPFQLAKMISNSISSRLTASGTH